MIQAAPGPAPFPSKDFLNPSRQEQSRIAAANLRFLSDTPSCIHARVGLFFDGTNNNMARDLIGKRIGLPDPQTGEPGPIASRKLSSNECSHSNVVRLFRTFPATEQTKGFFPFYMPGVGTEFAEIGELTESSEGKAFAKGGQARVTWGLFQALNALHMLVHDQAPQYTTEELKSIVQAYDRQVGRPEQQGPKGSASVMTHREWFAPHLARLEAALCSKPKPRIPSLSVSVFGFSRGAAEAVAFCHFFDELLDGGKLAGVPASINFLGIFDTVASVGLSASVSLTLSVPGALADGHWAWAERILEPLPACVENGLHYIAAHEQRMNFPVTQIRGNIQEAYFPGVHSDVGGGYAPGEQGKGRGAQGAMLSQIPLLHMYKAARLAGVPLTPFSELDHTIQDDLQLDARLASAWEAYTTELGAEGHLLREHMSLYYRWRAQRLNSLEQTASYQAADKQAQVDLAEANRMLSGDLEALMERRSSKPRFQPAAGGETQPEPPFAPQDLARINKWHYDRAQSGEALDDWERFALSIFEAPKPLPPEVLRFFDDYVHDSFAGFYLAGEVTEYDKRVKVDSVSKKQPDALSRFDRKVYDLAKRTESARARQEAGESLSEEDKKLADEAKFGTPYPIMSDADTHDMLNVIIATQTATRREGGGYIIQRGYYPQTGFFIRRSINQPMLDRSPSARAGGPATSAPQAEELQLAWSDNLGKDISIARAERHDPREMA